MSAFTRSFLALLAIPLLMGSRCAVDQPADTVAGPQGWTKAEQFAWYTRSQGSRLIPQKWLDALEQPSNAKAFLDPAYVDTFRYLPGPVNGWTGVKPDWPTDPLLPLGFVVDIQSDTNLRETKLRWMAGQTDQEPWVGMNCSACHTTSMTYKGKTFTFDGGPTLADFQSFMDALETSLENTLNNTPDDKDKFSRFAAKVLEKDDSDENRALLKAAMAKLVRWNKKLAALNATDMRYGFGRLDAIGHIYNKVALEALPEDDSDRTSQMANPSDAPVSYPFLWNITQLDYVEWNGIAQNKSVGFGAARDFNILGLGRNTGEVIGVFADITITPGVSLTHGYVSSINEPVLVGMEEQLQTLQPPKWPKEFPAIAQDQANLGAQLFASKGCADCHTVPNKPFTIKDTYKVTLTPIDKSGTDIWMACNAVLDGTMFEGTKSGAFAGSQLSIVSDQPVGAKSSNLNLVQYAVFGALLDKKADLAATAFEAILGIDRGLLGPHFYGQVQPKDARRNACMDALKNNPDLAKHLVYKARPLQGIWATAPYLHNGSVANLYELLLPPAQRHEFSTGSREFDPDKVGYHTDPSADNSFSFTVADPAGKPLDGNANSGHDYGNANITDPERKALIEYMKTL